MGTTVAQACIEVVERDVVEHEAPEPAEPADGLGGEAPRRGSAETDGDKVRRQRHIRRKTMLARRALAAHRR